jgi:hypothetical protein
MPVQPLRRPCVQPAITSPMNTASMSRRSPITTAKTLAQPGMSGYERIQAVLKSTSSPPITEKTRRIVLSTGSPRVLDSGQRILQVCQLLCGLHNQESRECSRLDDPDDRQRQLCDCSPSELSSGVRRPCCGSACTFHSGPARRSWQHAEPAVPSTSEWWTIRDCAEPRRVREGDRAGPGVHEMRSASVPTTSCQHEPDSLPKVAFELTEQHG